MHSSSDVGHAAPFGLSRLSQQLMSLFDNAGARAEERRQFSHLDRHLLEDVGLTPADVALGLQDIYANDFRVAHIAARRAA